MVVYEATTDEHFKKIMRFLQAQDSNSHARSCFNMISNSPVFKDSVSLFSAIRKRAQIFVCEDDKEIIRLVWGRSISEDKKRSFTQFLFMDDNDYKACNIQYYREMLLWACAHDYETYGITEYRGYFVDDDVLLKFARQVFGDALELRDQKKLEDGTHYFFVINIKKALGIA